MVTIPVSIGKPGSPVVGGGSRGGDRGTRGLAYGTGSRNGGGIANRNLHRQQQ